MLDGATDVEAPDVVLTFIVLELFNVCESLIVVISVVVVVSRLVSPPVVGFTVSVDAVALVVVACSDV